MNKGIKSANQIDENNCNSISEQLLKDVKNYIDEVFIDSIIVQKCLNNFTTE